MDLILLFGGFIGPAGYRFSDQPVDGGFGLLFSSGDRTAPDADPASESNGAGQRALRPDGYPLFSTWPANIMMVGGPYRPVDQIFANHHRPRHRESVFDQRHRQHGICRRIGLLRCGHLRHRERSDSGDEEGRLSRQLRCRRHRGHRHHRAYHPAQHPDDTHRRARGAAHRKAVPCRGPFRGFCSGFRCLSTVYVVRRQTALSEV